MIIILIIRIIILVTILIIIIITIMNMIIRHTHQSWASAAPAQVRSLAALGPECVPSPSHLQNVFVNFCHCICVNTNTYFCAHLYTHVRIFQFHCRSYYGKIALGSKIGCKKNIAHELENRNRNSSFSESFVKFIKARTVDVRKPNCTKNIRKQIWNAKTPNRLTTLAGKKSKGIEIAPL